MEVTIKVMNILIAVYCSQEDSAMYYGSSLLPWGPIFFAHSFIACTEPRKKEVYSSGRLPIFFMAKQSTLPIVKISQ